jgi:hypothetical protein
MFPLFWGRFIKNPEGESEEDSLQGLKFIGWFENNDKFGTDPNILSA